LHSFESILYKYESVKGSEKAILENYSLLHPQKRKGSEN